MNDPRDQPLTIAVENDALTIRIGAQTLLHALSGIDYLGEFEITDPETALIDLVRALKCEEEDGSTPVHRMLDTAFIDAVEHGSLAVTFEDDE